MPRGYFSNNLFRLLSVSQYIDNGDIGHYGAIKQNEPFVQHISILEFLLVALCILRTWFFWNYHQNWESGFRDIANLVLLNRMQIDDYNN